MKSKIFKQYEKEFEQSEFKDKPNLKQGWIMNKMKSDLSNYLFDLRNEEQIKSEINKG